MTADQTASWAFDAIGTIWRIDTAAPLPDDSRHAVTAAIAAFDADWSRFRPDSTVRTLARRGGAVPAPPDAVAMLDAYAELAAATDGAINPLVGDSLEQLGYDGDYAFRPGTPRPAPEEWRSLLGWSDGALALGAPAVIDVGALGKGRLVDIVHDLLTATVPGPVVVDAGGDIVGHGRTERIALEHPFDRTRAVGVWEVADAALCASATNRRAWGEGLHHVLDARTGEPVRTVAATWAVASTAMWADALATALFFDGGPRLAHAHGVEWVRMTTDGRLEWSPGCRADLFARRTSVEG